LTQRDAPPGGSRPYREVVLGNQVAFLAQAPEGERNNQLARAPYIVGQYTDAGRLDPDRVERRPYAAGMMVGAAGIEPATSPV
jgi:hypothetical protein